MLEERLESLNKRVRDNVQSELKAYTDGGEKEIFRLTTEVYGKNSPTAVLDLPTEGYYDDDIPVLVEIILKLVADQKDRLPDMHKQLKKICREHSGLTPARKLLEELREEGEPDLSSSYVIGSDGRLREELIKEDE